MSVPILLGDFQFKAEMIVATRGLQSVHPFPKIAEIEGARPT